MYNTRFHSNGSARGDAERPGTNTRGGEDEYVLPLGDLLRVIRRRLWIIMFMTVVGTAAALASSFVQKPTYEASTQIIVGQQSGIAEDPNLALGLQQMTQTLTQALSSNRVAERVIEQEKLGMTSRGFLEKLNVQQIPETQLIQVDYRDTSPQRAQRVADTVAKIFSDEIAEVSPSANAITATVWELAVVPEEPVSPNPLLYGVFGLLLGSLLGVGAAFLLEYLDDSWRSPEEVERISGVFTIGVIPEFKAAKSKQRSKQKSSY